MGLEMDSLSTIQRIIILMRMAVFVSTCDPKWMQIGEQYPKEWTHIQTKGSLFLLAWVTSYQIQYSLDGDNFLEYTGGGSEVITITANSGTDTLANYTLDPTIIARVLRIIPIDFQTEALEGYACSGMRIEAYYRDSQPLHKTNNLQAAASSAGYQYSSSYRAYTKDNHLLDCRKCSYCSYCYSSAWRADTRSNEFLQLGMIYPKYWKIVATRGDLENNYYTISYLIKYTLDGETWIDSGTTYSANEDNSNVVNNTINNTPYARAIRIYPQQTYNYGEATLAIEAYYFDEPCSNECIECNNNNPEECIKCAGGYLINIDSSTQTQGQCILESECSKVVLILDNVAKCGPPMISVSGELALSVYQTYTYLITIDPEVTPLSYIWSKKSGSEIDLSSVVLDDASFTLPGILLEVAKTYEFQVEVIFSEAFSVTESFEITVEDPIIEFNGNLYEFEEHAALCSGGSFGVSSVTSKYTQFNYMLDMSRTNIYETGEEENPWVQISAGQIVQFTGIATRGKQTNIFDGTYSAKYSLDGLAWTEIQTEIFEGSIESSYYWRNSFTTPVIARTIRIYPKNTRVDYYSFQLEAYFEEYSVNSIYANHAGNEIAAIESGAGIVVSSYSFDSSDPNLFYRLGYGVDIPNNPIQGFKFQAASTEEYFQIGVVSPKMWAKIEVQGAETGNSEWLTSFKIQYSNDSISWTQYSSTLTANSDESTLVTQTFSSSFQARAIRLVPLTWNTFPAFRIRPYYKEPTSVELSTVSLDEEVAAIGSGAAVEASSYFSNEFRFDYLLNTQNGITQCWRPSNDQEGEWIQIGTLTKKLWTKIETQGRYQSDEFVRTFKIQYTVDGNYWKKYKSGLIFTANTDSDTIVPNIMDPPIRAVALRIFPIQYNSHMSMRVEASFKELCDWRCDECTIPNDNTKCLSCSSLEGIEGSDNRDGTYTCDCGSSYTLHIYYESCTRNYESLFDLSSSSDPLSNLGDSEATFLSIQNGLNSPEEYIGQSFTGSENGYLQISSQDLLFGAGGISFAIYAYTNSKSDQFLVSSDEDQPQYAVKLMSSGVIEITLPRKNSELLTIQPFLYPTKKWFLVVVSFVNNAEAGTGKVTADLKIEGSTSWEETFENTITEDAFLFIEDSNYFINFGFDFEGIIHSIAFKTYADYGVIPYDKSEFLHCDSSCLENSLCVGISINENGCTRCSTGNPVLLDLSHGKQLGKCLNECPSGFYSDFSASVPSCQECPENCLECSSSLEGSCSKCDEEYVLKIISASDSVGRCISPEECTMAIYSVDSVEKCGPVTLSVIGESSISKYSIYVFSAEIFPFSEPESFTWDLISGALDVSSLSLSEKNLQIPPNLVEVNENYVFSVGAYFSESYEVFATISFAVENPITIVFTGEMEREITVAQSFQLDASESFIEGGDENLFFEWNCFNYETVPFIPCVLYDKEESFTQITGSLISFKGKYFKPANLYFKVRVYTLDCEKTLFPILVKVENVPPVSMQILPSLDKFPTTSILSFRMEAQSQMEDDALEYIWTLSDNRTVITAGLKQLGKYLSVASDTLCTSTKYLLVCRVETSLGFGILNKEFTTSAPIDVSNATLARTPEEGEALVTLFVISAEGFIDGEGGILYYRFLKQYYGDDDLKELRAKDVSNEVTTRIGGSRDYGIVEVQVEVTNEYNQSATLTEFIIYYKPVSVSDQESFVMQKLNSMTGEEKSEFVVAAAETILTVSENVYDSRIEKMDVCGGCYLFGDCNITTKTCVCYTGYTISVDCRISDEEALSMQQIISTLLEEVETESGEGSSSINQNFISSLKTISDNQDIISSEQNTRIHNTLRTFLQENISEQSAIEGAKITANLMKTTQTQFKQQNDSIKQQEIVQEAMEIFNTNTQVLKSAADFLEIGESKQLNNSSTVKTMMTKISIKNLSSATSKCVDDSDLCSNSIEFSENPVSGDPNEPILMVSSFYEESPIPLTSSTIASIKSELNLNESEKANSTTEILNSISLNIYQEDEALSVNPTIKITLSLRETSSIRRSLVDYKSFYTCLRFDSNSNEFVTDGMELEDIIEGEYAICLANEYDSTGLFSITSTILETSFDAILENVETLTNFTILSEYPFYTSFGMILFFSIC